MFDERAEVESAGLGDRAGGVDFGEVLGRGGEQLGGATIRRQFKEETKDGEAGAIGGFVHHVHFKREVLLVDAMLGGSVQVVLSQVEGGATDSCGTVDDNLESAAEVLKLGRLNVRDFDDRGL